MEHMFTRRKTADVSALSSYGSCETKNKRCGSCILTTKLVTRTNYYDNVLLSEVFVEKFVLSAMIVSSLLLNARKNLPTMCCGGGGLGHSGYLCSKKQKNTANSKKSDLKFLLKYF
jgi:hypothetical protein